MPPQNSLIGFAPADWLLAFLVAFLLFAVFVWNPAVERAFTGLAQRTRICMLLLFAMPILLRLLLLPRHPVPTPEIYDEFSHLLLADTLLHGRLANPPHPLHQFFETFFVLQQPTYSSIYPLGQGLVLAFGRLISGTPWTGVLIATGSFCALCYWMLRAWVPSSWALLGGIVAVIEFGPLSQSMNSYWGGAFTAAGGCLVFGALPRLRAEWRGRDAVLASFGFAMNMLTRQFESLLLFVAVMLFFAPSFLRRAEWPKIARCCAFALAVLLPISLLILLQNKAVTHAWSVLPEQLSRYQYGVPASLTIEPNPTPHVPLTPQQKLDYEAQSLTHGPDTDSVSKFLLRLEYRVRYYRFFFFPPLYLTGIAFLFTLRSRRMLWVAGTLAIFALGTNLFPYLLVHYLAAVTCLFVLVSVAGLRQLSLVRLRDAPVGVEIVRVLVALCLAEFLCWYSLHLFETPGSYAILQYETWDVINHDNPRRRIEVRRQLAAIPGQLLVFVHYSPHHVYQDEWVWNGADIDASRIVFARYIDATENDKLIRYYPHRKVLLLEPDGESPRLSDYNSANSDHS